MAECTVCSIDGCDKDHVARGWCRMHYRRWLRHGDPRFRVRIAPGESFKWLIANKDYAGDGCLIWPFGGCDTGYGYIHHNGRGSLPSRVMCTLVHGEPEHPDLNAAHNCGQGSKGCVAPEHLRWASPYENAQDRILHETSGKGEKNGQAKLTLPDVLEIKRLRGVVSQGKLAKRFGVSASTVAQIQRGERWAWAV